MSETREIPNGWKIVRLGDVCSFEYGKALKAANRKKGGNFPVLGSNGCVGFHDTYLVNGPGVVIGRKGAAGEISFVGKNFWPIDTTYFLKLNKDLSLLYFYFLLKSLRLNQFEKSTAIPGLNRNDAYDQRIPLPPLPEQHRIVAKIEELFSSLDKGIQSLKTAQQQLKVYRQAVLKWAFEGKLTNKYLVDGELPLGWKRVALKTITTKAKKVKSKEKKATDEFLYIDIGGIDSSINKIVTHKRYKWKDAPSRAQQIVKYEDTLFSTVRTYLRNIALVDKLIYEDQICSSGFTVIRAKYDEIVPKYLFHYSTFEGFIQPLNELQTGSSYPAVRDDDVLNQYINMPTELEDQHAIVAEIESRLSVCDKIEESIEHSLKQSEALRQSILKKAFEGKLVPQDPSDEPTSVLLDRIKAEREKDRLQNERTTMRKRDAFPLSPRGRGRG